MNWLLRALACIVFLLPAGCGESPAAARHVFVTDHGLGPDKWATAWLLTRKVVPGAKLTVVGADQPLPAGTAFDVPHAPVRRQGNQAAFEVARVIHAITDPDVQRLAQIVHDIEVNFWSQEIIPESPLIEQGFRSLQRNPASGEVTPECYLAFFDSVYEAVGDQRATGKAMSMDDLATDCKTAAHVESRTPLVREIPIPHLLAEMQRGKRVIFVDVREANEFAEAHIPGAHNITLRELSPEAIRQVQGADYVVSYCVKDFRGFEMAKALAAAGVQNSVILKPYGIKGWLSQGLPTAGAKALDEVEAVGQLSRCIELGFPCQSPLASRQ